MTVKIDPKTLYMIKDQARQTEKDIEGMPDKKDTLDLSVEIKDFAFGNKTINNLLQAVCIAGIEILTDLIDLKSEVDFRHKDINLIYIFHTILHKIPHSHLNKFLLFLLILMWTVVPVQQHRWRNQT